MLMLKNNISLLDVLFFNEILISHLKQPKS